MKYTTSDHFQMLAILNQIFDKHYANHVTKTKQPMNKKTDNFLNFSDTELSFNNNVQEITRMTGFS